MREGQQVVWLHEMRGGYGYVEEIPAIVERLHRERATIRVPLKNGRTTTRVVHLSNLRARTETRPPYWMTDWPLVRCPDCDAQMNWGEIDPEDVPSEQECPGCGERYSVRLAFITTRTETRTQEQNDGDDS